MTIAGVICIALGLVLSLFIAVGVRSMLCLALFFYHLSASFLFWLYSLNEPVDSMGYYSAPYNPTVQLEPGTVFVQWLTATLRDLLDASYLDMFMLFHIAGYLGVILLYQVCKLAMQAESESDFDRPQLMHLLLFLPGLHVWTSAIGKDSLVFLGVASFIWGIARFRLIFLIMGLLICSAIRPHIAAVLAASCALALVFSGGVHLHWRVLISAALTVAGWYGLPHLQSFLGLQELDSTSVIEYVEKRQGHTLVGGSGVEISEYSFPMQFLTFMYRPFFFDARGVLGLVVSFENLIYAIASVLYLPRAIGLLFRGENTYFLRFNFIYWVIATGALASATSNIGLAIRQKVMIVPALVVLFLAGYAKDRSKEQATELAPTTAP